MKEMMYENPAVKRAALGAEQVWINPKLKEGKAVLSEQELTMADIEDASQRLERFKPFIMKCFPETIADGGRIESALTPVPKMQERLKEKYQVSLEGQLLLKQDSHLAIAGSIKARGGIYEVLKYTEELALTQGLLKNGDSYEVLNSPEARKFFGEHTIQVGSTGNLGLSIGIASAAVGYQVIVHMSADARQWKKDLLRDHGVIVREYQSDYSEAVKQGRKESDQDPKSYFVDDENSQNLFLGYAVAALRLQEQLADLEIVVDADHPLFVYLPCGVGGAPGGIAFGLKQLFGDHVHCFFIEPTQAPCMLIGMASGLHQQISVQDIGLSGQTDADGLAVGRASGFVGRVMEPLLSGVITLNDDKLYHYMRDLLDSEGIFLEPSAGAAFEGPIQFAKDVEMAAYINQHNLTGKLGSGVHIAWATGGKLVPESIRQEYQNTYL